MNILILLIYKTKLIEKSYHDKNIHENVLISLIYETKLIEQIIFFLFWHVTIYIYIYILFDTIKKTKIYEDDYLISDGDDSPLPS